MNLPFYIARRYLFAKKSHNVINIISAISAVSMAVGTAALIIILSIYNGFDKIVADSLPAIDPDILVRCDTAKVFEPVEIHSLPEGAVVSHILQENVFASYGGAQSVARLRGVDSAYFQDSPLKDKVIDGEFMLYRGDVPLAAVGAGLASKMNISPRFVDKIELYFPDRTSNISISNPLSSIEFIKLRPSCIFSVNAEADAQMIIAPIDEVRYLLDYETAVSAMEIRLPGADDRQIKSTVKAISGELGPGWTVLDRYHQNEALFKMMSYEKGAIYLILLFIIIIIGFNIFGSLSMLMIEKKGDIQTLFSMGASERLVRRIFLLEGWMISLLGLFAGLAAGIAFALAQQKFGFIKMPGSFQISAYPIIIQLSDIILTACGVAAIGYFIALLPASSIRR